MSIPLGSPTFRLPDFRNLGVWLRLLLAANAVLFAIVLAGNRQIGQLPIEFATLAALVEPSLLAILSLLFALSPRLQSWPGAWAGVLVVGIAMGVIASVDFLLSQLFFSRIGWRAPAAAGVTTALLLYWFSLRARAQAPALTEARLTALTARIRPHFFFNSLNAVLGIMREDPRRAETALEELSELFRVLMRDNRELLPMSEEIALARKYLDIERLRLGERLQVKWTVESCPPDMLSPPLLLQPLLENAVYHGIEPLGETGEIQVRITGSGDAVCIEIDNPFPAGGDQRVGNHMALDNLRERLMLFYDLEARLDTGIKEGRYWVRVILPVRKPS